MSDHSTGIAENGTGASDAPLFVASIGVRWRDLDAFNHVNNSNYSPTSKRHGCSG